MKMPGWEGEARSSSVERTLCVELIQSGMEAQVSAWLSQPLVQDDAFLSVCHFLFILLLGSLSWGKTLYSPEDSHLGPPACRLCRASPIISAGERQNLIRFDIAISATYHVLFYLHWLWTLNALILSRKWLSHIILRTELCLLPSYEILQFAIKNMS